MVKEPKMEKLDAYLEAVEALGLVVAGESYGAARQICIV